MRNNLGLYFIVFSMGILSLNAQNYQNICSPGNTYFGSHIHVLKSFRRDSAQLVPSSYADSIIWSFLTIQDVTGYPPCLDTTFGSILGQKVLQKASGDFIFFNKNGDSIYIRPNYPIMQSWKCVNLPDNCYLNATIIQVSEDTVLGVPDSVKTIILQAKNAGGQNISHNFNGKEIHISKSFGFTLIYDLVRFPDDTAAYRLEGKSSPAIGYQDFSIEECYDFDVGDEFHYMYLEPLQLDFRIQRVLNKSVSVTGDTIIYTWERCVHSHEGPYWVNIHDTIEESIILHSLSFYSQFLKQPFEYDPYLLGNYFYCNRFERISTNYNSRSTKRIRYKKHMKGSCWLQTDYHKHYDYSKGLGLTHNYYTFKWEQFPGYWIWLEIYDRLIYYLKGTETWGTPYAPDCETLVKIDTIYRNPSHTLLIVPNPVRVRAEISVYFLEPGEKANLVLFDYLGREIFRDSFHANPYIFFSNRISPGLYIIKVISTTGKINATGKIVIE